MTRLLAWLLLGLIPWTVASVSVAQCHVTEDLVCPSLRRGMCGDSLLKAEHTRLREWDGTSVMARG